MSNKMEEITLASALSLNPALVLREEDDCALLYDPDTGDVRVLNPTATAVCKLLDGRRTVAGIMEMLKESFEGMAADADRQVLALIEELYRVGAIGTLTELK